MIAIQLLTTIATTIRTIITDNGATIMPNTYKRIITISDEPSSRTDLLSWAGSDLTIRKTRAGSYKNEYVLESEYGTERRTIDKLVKIFDVSQ